MCMKMIIVVAIVIRSSSIIYLAADLTDWFT